LEKRERERRRREGEREGEGERRSMLPLPLSFVSLVVAFSLHSLPHIVSHAALQTTYLGMDNKIKSGWRDRGRRALGLSLST
jgi:hypothetical protein